MMVNWSDLDDRLSSLGPLVEGGATTKLVTGVDLKMWMPLDGSAYRKVNWMEGYQTLSVELVVS